MADDSERLRFWKRFGSRTGVPMEGFSFIFHAFDYVQDCLQDPTNVEAEVAPRLHCSATFYCRLFIRLAQDSFGPDYVAVLRSWRLDTSEKLGAAVYVLVRRGILRMQ